MSEVLPAVLDVRRLGLGAQLVDYEAGWQLQREIHERVVAGSAAGTVLMLEHAPVFTAGRRTQPEDRPQDGSRVIEVDRGGRITWHGPGQIVCYPIVTLPQPFDVVAHVRRLEAAIMAVCAELGVATVRVDGRSGVWCEAANGKPERKVAAIGVRVARGVTMHGLALNVNCDLSWAQRIVACGIPDAGVTSIAAELGHDADLLAVADLLERELRETLEPTLTSERRLSP